MGDIPRFTADPVSQSSWAAPTRQQASNMRGLISSGKVLMGAVLTYPSTQVAKTLAVTGADWIWIVRRLRIHDDHDTADLTLHRTRSTSPGRRHCSSR
jgi:hypothetical protein